MVNILVGILILLMIMIGFMPDVHLEPAARQLLDKAQGHESGDAYYFLMGIDAAAGEDPVEVGKKIYASIRQGEDNYLNNGKPFEYEEYPDELRLPLSDSEFFCRSWEDGCIESLFQDPPILAEFIASHTILSDRYREFINFDDFSTLSRSSIFEPFPAYQYISRGNRLTVLRSIWEAKNSNIDGAVSLLLDNISGLRKQLALADTLIGKMLFILQISENLDVLALIAREAGYDPAPDIEPLSGEEKYFEIVSARELGFSHDTNMAFHRNSDLFTEDNSESGWFKPAWLIRPFFKPNMTTNALLPVYEQAIHYSILSHSEFTSRVKNGSNIKLQQSFLLNPVGTYINGDIVPDYSQYVARFFDLDVKIELFNLVMNHASIESAMESANNPYYETKNRAYMTDDREHICFDGPLEDNHNLRCLKIKM